MQKTDIEKKSLFEVAGRVFYEAHVFGYRVTSFTNSGFLEDMHYEMQPISSSKLEFLKRHILEISILLTIIGLYKHYKNRPKTEKKKVIPKTKVY